MKTNGFHDWSKNVCMIKNLPEFSKCGYGYFESCSFYINQTKENKYILFTLGGGNDLYNEMERIGFIYKEFHESQSPVKAMDYVDFFLDKLLTEMVFG